MPFKRFTIFYLLSLYLLFPALVYAAENNSKSASFSHSKQLAQAIIDKYIDSGGFIFTSQKGVIEHNRYKLFTPASILKIATASAAFEILGPQYRFTTSFYQNDNGDIFIKGSGDPFLTSEEISSIWSVLTNRQIRPFKRVYIDNSYFDLDSSTADGANGSINPYDALNSSLAVNFNTLPIVVGENTISSLEDQTPLLPLMKKYAYGQAQGNHRISISNDQDDIVTYTGELFIHLSPYINSSDTIAIGEKKVPEELKPFYLHQSSKSLHDIISPLLLYSNNFIANQIFLACGARKYGKPATWEKGKNALELFLNQKLKIDTSQFIIQEGSGLSRKNKLSPDAMLTILRHFETYHNLLPRNKDMFIKSGTLTGVYSYAGYVSEGFSSAPFVIILNQKKNTRDHILKEFTNK